MRGKGRKATLNGVGVVVDEGVMVAVGVVLGETPGDSVAAPEGAD